MSDDFQIKGFGLEAPKIESWIETRSGIKFNFLDPKPEEIEIADIAYSLANQCRYNGHCSRFYSVAEHSVLVASLLPKELRLAGLLHDAAEAYLSDIPSPIKQYMPEYRVLEKKVQDAIDKKFGINSNLSEIKTADRQQLCSEAHALIPSQGKEWIYTQGVDYRNGKKPLCLRPHEAFATFIAAFENLTETTKLICLK